MEREEKIKVAITAGIAGLILLILVLYLALTGNIVDKSSDEDKLAENITEYASNIADSGSELTGEDALNAENDGSGNLANAGDDKNSENNNEADGKKPSNSYLAQNTTVSGNSFYATNAPVLRNVYKKVTYNVETQLSDMLTYWNDGNQAAVRDLAHLERYEAMSFSLDGTTDFYYYGNVDAEGNPEGMGVAVYANNQYYFGQWSQGKRNGNGTWIAFYPAYNTYVVKEHLYTGEFAGDLPNGEGQEHYDYDQEYMNSADIYIQNAIGHFTDGLYDGEMYLITVNDNYETKEWTGKCTRGTLEQVPNTSKDNMGYIAVFSGTENSDDHMWMTETKTKNVGVSGMITGGKKK